MPAGTSSERTATLLPARPGLPAAWATEALDDAELAIVAWGSTVGPARDAVVLARSHGLRVGLVRPLALPPLAGRLPITLTALRGVLVADVAGGRLARTADRALGDRVPVVAHPPAEDRPPRARELVAALARLYALTPTRPTAEAAWAAEPDPLSLVEDGAWADRGVRIEPVVDEPDDPTALIARGLRGR